MIAGSNIFQDEVGSFEIERSNNKEQKENLGRNNQNFNHLLPKDSNYSFSSNSNPTNHPFDLRKFQRRQKIRQIFNKRISKKSKIQYKLNKSLKNGLFNEIRDVDLQLQLHIPVFESKFHHIRPFVINRDSSNIELRNILYKEKIKSFRKPDIIESYQKERLIYLPGIGNNELGDYPENISEVLKIKDRYFFKVEWRTRMDGTIPLSTILSTEELKDIDPYFLLSFYESKIHSKSKSAYN